MQLTRTLNKSKQHQWLRLSFVAFALAVTVDFSGRAWANPNVPPPIPSGANGGTKSDTYASSAPAAAAPDVNADTPGGSKVPNKAPAPDAGCENTDRNKGSETQRASLESESANTIVLLDDKTQWQAQNNQVKFTVTGSNIQNSAHQLKACMCWKCEAQRSAHCWTDDEKAQQSSQELSKIEEWPDWTSGKRQIG